MSSIPFDLAEQLQFLGTKLMSGASNNKVVTSTGQKTKRIVKKPRRLLSDFGATLNEKQKDHATSTPINKTCQKTDGFLENVHERPTFEEIPPKRTKVTAWKNPFPKPHTSKTVAGMQNNLNLLDDQGIQVKQVDCIRIAQLNAHGALTDEKIWYVKEFILIHKPDIILVNEFGQTTDLPVYPKIETYKLVTYELKSAFSGVAVYVQASLLQATRILKPKNNMAFSQIAGINIQGMSIYTVYRSPSELSKLETNLFCEWIESLPNQNVLIIGDLNLHVDWASYESNKHEHYQIAQSLLTRGFVQYQQDPTFQHKSNRTLDVTLCNSLNRITLCTTDPTFIIPKIDHIPTITDVRLDVDKIVEKEIFMKKKRDVDKYKEIVGKGIDNLGIKHFRDLDEVQFSVEKIENMESDMTKLLLKAERETVPKVKIKIDQFKPNQVNSMSAKSKHLLQKKRHLLKAGRYAAVTKNQKELDESLAADRAKSAQAFTNKLKQDKNFIWTVAKNSTVTASTTGGLQRPDGTLSFDEKEKVELLKDRYDSVLTEKTEPTCNVNDLSTCKTTPGFGEVEFSSSDIVNTLFNCNNSMASDSRGLYMPLFRDAREELSVYLALLFTMAVKMGHMALAWLLAMVLPIPKPGDLSIPKNWRPITLEQTCLRVLEKAYNFKFVKYLEEIGFFHWAQFGFRLGRSTIHNLICYWTYIVKLVRVYGAVDVIYADTSAAFDRLSHGPLLDMLFHDCGVYGSAWHFLKSWLTGRKQFVKWNGQTSEEMTVSSSCMQGSCLGTTLWNVYFNGVLKKLEMWIDELKIVGCTFFVYADDIKICFPAIPENYPKINELMLRLQNEMKRLKLKFNALKCAVLTIGGDKNPKRNVYMSGENDELVILKRSEAERDLGVMVDSDGSFKTHVKKALGVAKATMKILRRIFKKAAYEDKVKLYHAYIFSRMGYGSEIWRPSDRATLDEFNKIYKDFFKFTVVDRNCNPPWTPEQLFVEKDLLMLYDIFHNRSPLHRAEIFDNEYVPNDGVTTRSASQNLVRNEMSDRWKKSLLVERNRDTWNSVPRNIREGRSRDDFKSYVRENILSKLECNKMREDFVSGALREEAIRHEKHLNKARQVANINRQVGNETNIQPNDFLLNEDFKDDFLKPDLCLKKMKRSNVNKLKQLSKIAPWMLFCKCDSPICIQEINDYEAVHGPLRNQPRVVIVEDKVIIKDKFLMNTVKKLSDYFETDNNLFHD